jgi:hypothetical protein
MTIMKKPPVGRPTASRQSLQFKQNGPLNSPKPAATQGRLHPLWIGGRTAARALLAQAITGKLTLLDGKTGRPRVTVDIQKAAKLAVREDRRKGPLFVKHVPWSQKVRQTVEGEAYSREDGRKRYPKRCGAE